MKIKQNLSAQSVYVHKLLMHYSRAYLYAICASGRLKAPSTKARVLKIFASRDPFN